MILVTVFALMSTRYPPAPVTITACVPLSVTSTRPLPSSMVPILVYARLLVRRYTLPPATTMALLPSSGTCRPRSGPLGNVTSGRVPGVPYSALTALAVPDSPMTGKKLMQACASRLLLRSR